MAFAEMFCHLDPNWNPHLKLEYAKMCIRTVAEQAQAERKKKELSKEEAVSKLMARSVLSPIFLYLTVYNFC